MEQGIANTCQSLNSLLSLWLALSMRMTNPGLIRPRGYRGVFYFFFLNQRASRTTEMVTVRQLAQCYFEIVRRKWAPFCLDQNSTEWIFFPTRPYAILSLCYFSWFRPSQHSHGNGNIGYQVLLDDANFGRVLVGSLFFNSLTRNRSATLSVWCVFLAVHSPFLSCK